MTLSDANLRPFPGPEGPAAAAAAGTFPPSEEILLAMLAINEEGHEGHEAVTADNSTAAGPEEEVEEEYDEAGDER